MRCLLFKGNAVTKTFGLYKHEGIKAEVAPSLLIRDAKDCWGEEEIQMGLLIECRPLAVLDGADEEASLEPFEEFTGHSAMFDPVRWWRALQFLEALPVIEDDLLHFGIYWGTDRDPDSSFKHYADALRQAVGDQQYDEIMSRPVPQEIIRCSLCPLRCIGRDRRAHDPLEPGTSQDRGQASRLLAGVCRGEGSDRDSLRAVPVCLCRSPGMPLCARPEAEGVDLTPGRVANSSVR